MNVSLVNVSLMNVSLMDVSLVNASVVNASFLALCRATPFQFPEGRHGPFLAGGGRK